MGLSIAGVAFLKSGTTPEEFDLVRKAFGNDFRLMTESELQSAHDIRINGNMAIESTGGSFFIYSADLADQLLFKEEAIKPSLLTACGQPSTVVAFCHFESGDSFGYSVIENGQRTRLRVYSLGTTRDEGIPKEFELPWIQASNTTVDGGDEIQLFRNSQTGETATEAQVTAKMLRAALNQYVDGCPWDHWNDKTRLSCYRKMIPEANTGKPTKPRWRFW